MSQLVRQLWQNLHRTPQRPRLIEGETHWTALQLAERLAALTHWVSTQAKLHDWHAGDRVALWLGNQKEMLLALLALRAKGLVPVPVNLQWGVEDTAYVLQHAGVKGLLTSAPLIERIRPLVGALPCWALEPLLAELTEMSTEGYLETHLVQTLPDELALLIYTSGTTARPKGVMLSEANLLANMIGIDETGILGDPAVDRLLMALPLFHAYGLTLSLYALQAGVPMVLEPSFQPKALLRAMAQHQVTVLPLVPTMFRVLAEAAQKPEAQPALAHLKWCVSGGAALPPVLLERLGSAGLRVLEGYGLTETSPVVAVNRPHVGPQPGSVGLPLPNVMVRIANADENGVGEVEINAPSVMLGYYQAPQATTDVMTLDGWLKTGDLGRLNTDGTLSLTDGRIKDLIIKHGENIAPQRVEAALLEHPAIAEVCVFGQPDAKAGEVVVACLVLNENSQALTDAELLQWCKQVLPPLYVPSQLHLLAELPKNATGKILRRTLKEQFAPVMVTH